MTIDTGSESSVSPDWAIEDINPGTSNGRRSSVYCAGIQDRVRIMELEGAAVFADSPELKIWEIESPVSEFS